MRVVYISSGRETGGLSSFANALHSGFIALGVRAELISPKDILRQAATGRLDVNAQYILSTSAAFALPFLNDALYVAHGIPRRDAQSHWKVNSILFAYGIASRRHKLVAVSHYVKQHLEGLYGLKIRAVVHNPVAEPFFTSARMPRKPRTWITFVGRLDKAKNVHRLIPPILNALRDPRFKHLTIQILGDGPEAEPLKQAFRGNPKITFWGKQDVTAIVDALDQSVLFFSGCETEAFGITYAEALLRGCNVLMPACGGGIEIAPLSLERNVFAFPLSFDVDALTVITRRALVLQQKSPYVELATLRPDLVAREYLRLFNNDRTTFPSHSTERQQ